MLFFTVTIFYGQTGASQKSSDEKSTYLYTALLSKDMSRDLFQLKETILKTHPAPFFYRSDSLFNAAYDEAVRLVQKPKTVLEFAQVINGFTSVIEDSHTALNPRELLRLDSKKRKISPFHLKEIGEKFYLSKILNDAIPLGVEVLAVNKQSINELYDLTETLAPSEGPAKSARKELIEIMMGLVFNLFNKMPTDPVNITYVYAGDTLIDVAPSIKLNRYFGRNSWYKKNDIEYRLSDSVAYLGLKSFESRRERKYKRVINSFFKKLERKGISNVILDVRGNRGGYVLLLEHVLSYINAKGETFDLNYLYKRSKLDRFETLSRFKKLDFVKKALRVYPQGMISKEYDFYKSPMGSMSSILYQKKLTNPLGMTYTGKCALLTDGLSMSASVLLASWFKGHNRGQVIGTPCFGSMQGTHGNAARIVLENSRIPITISTLKLSSVEQPLIEIIPTKKIQYSVNDLILGRDPFIEYLEVLKNEQPFPMD